MNTEQEVRVAEEGDMEILCIQCNKPFVFNKGEQEFFEKKGFHPPKRCPMCRQKRKQERRQNEY